MNNFKLLKICRGKNYCFYKNFTKHIYKQEEWKELFDDAKSTIKEAEKYFNKAKLSDNRYLKKNIFFLKTGHRLLGIGCELFLKSLLLKENYSINELKNKKKILLSQQIITLTNIQKLNLAKTVSLSVILNPDNIKKIKVNFIKFDNLINNENKQMLNRQKQLSQKNLTYQEKYYPAKKTTSSGLFNFILLIRNSLIHSDNLPTHFVYEYENVIKLIKFICKEKKLKFTKDDQIDILVKRILR